MLVLGLFLIRWTLWWIWFVLLVVDLLFVHFVCGVALIVTRLDWTWYLRVVGVLGLLAGLFVLLVWLVWRVGLRLFCYFLGFICCCVCLWVWRGTKMQFVGILVYVDGIVCLVCLFGLFSFAWSLLVMICAFNRLVFLVCWLNFTLLGDVKCISDCWFCGIVWTYVCLGVTVIWFVWICFVLCLVLFSVLDWCVNSNACCYLNVKCYY